MKQRGFTLIELLVVIAIIGLLSAVAVFSLNSVRADARDARRLSDINQIQAALDHYYTDNNAYPQAQTVLNLGIDVTALCNSTVGLQDSCGDNETPYMTLLPHDPLSSQAYVYQATDGTSYNISYTLEGEVNGFSGQLSATPSGITEVTP